MKLTPDLQKKVALISVFVLLMAGVLYYDLRDDSTPAPTPAPVVTTAPTTPSKSASGAEAKNVGTTAAALDPTLHMGPMLVTESLVYSGSGRNIFSASAAPVDIPKPIAPARPNKQVAPMFAQPIGPPPPPPIDLKFFGTETSQDGHVRAFLLNGEDVFLASPGDIVKRRYKVDSIGRNSIVVEDLTDNNRQTLPLIGH